MKTPGISERWLVLDAMGVIFRAADDVAELRVSFVREAGGVENVGHIEVFMNVC